MLTFLTGQINYGGRVTDDWDRRCLMTSLADYITPSVVLPTYSYSPSGVYHTIDGATLKDYTVRAAAAPSAVLPSG